MRLPLLFTLRPARFVLRWMTVRRYSVLLCVQTPRLTQPPTLSGMGNEYRSWSIGSAVDRDDNGGSAVLTDCGLSTYGFSSLRKGGR